MWAALYTYIHAAPDGLGSRSAERDLGVLVDTGNSGPVRSITRGLVWAVVISLHLHGGRETLALFQTNLLPFCAA